MLLEKLTLFPNASIVLEDVDTHKSTLGRGVNAQTKRRQSHVNAGTVPESENVRSTCGWLKAPPFVDKFRRRENRC